MIHMLISIFASLLLTLTIELGTAWIFHLRGRENTLVVIAVNLITNPPCVFCHLIGRLFISRARLLLPTLLMEGCIVLLEGFLYQKKATGCSHPYLFSLAANGASFGAGLLINHLI